MKKAAAPKAVAGYTNAQLVAFCGINCKDCKARSQRRLQLGQRFKESLQELPLELFSHILPPYKNIKQVIEFLDSFPQMGAQTCCKDAGSPCGNPMCEIRTCVNGKGFRTCADALIIPRVQNSIFPNPIIPSSSQILIQSRKKGLTTMSTKQLLNSNWNQLPSNNIFL